MSSQYASRTDGPSSFEQVNKIIISRLQRSHTTAYSYQCRPLKRRRGTVRTKIRCATFSRNSTKTQLGQRRPAKGCQGTVVSRSLKCINGVGIRRIKRMRMVLMSHNSKHSHSPSNFNCKGTSTYIRSSSKGRKQRASSSCRVKVT